VHTQKTKLEKRLHQIYIGKIDCKVSEEFYDEMTDKWLGESNQIKEAIGLLRVLIAITSLKASIF